MLERQELVAVFHPYLQRVYGGDERKPYAGHQLDDFRNPHREH